MLAIKTVPVKPIAFQIARNANFIVPFSSIAAQVSQRQIRGRAIRHENGGVPNAKMAFLLADTRSSFSHQYSQKISDKPDLTKHLPDRQQVEKYFFRFVVVVWDITAITYNFTKENFIKYVVNNPTVQLYWKQFHTKMEAARKK